MNNLFKDASDVMEDMDGISNSPEPIQHHILSFLSFKHVVKTSVLSKTWAQVWRRFPFLVFDSTFFNQIPWRLELWKAFNYIEETLHSRQKEKARIKMFALDLKPIRPSFKKFEPFIDQCIYFALEGDFPQVFLCSKSLNVLVLTSSKLESPRSVWLPSLRELHLSEVNADDQVIKNLVAGCPLIEVLCIRTCGGFKSLELIGHSNKLNEIRVFDNKELKWVPFVPCEINVASCKNLKSLKISRASSITDEWLCSHISNCPLLESLTIDSCPRFTSVKISSLHLKQFCIMDCESLAEVQIETPNLRIFKYSGSIISFISDALTLSEADLCVISDDMDTQWYVKYNLIVPEEVRQIHPSPLRNVKHLTIFPTLGCLSVAVTDAIDGALWISLHAKTFKFSYKKLPVYEGGIAQCCTAADPVSSHVGNSVWRKYIVKGEYIWKKIVSLTELSTPLDDY
ncbi:F-box/LRR-repeat protein 25 [Citrus sinensis]|uniref:F-box/LRR-repeat protein 25 n=1 Tax=Citrus sinensis TaxID=2711 RepID=A0ACB8J5L3_CITSI|nr:F-box/LRR-repeat protein 25 [Citrus sinensis]